MSSIGLISENDNSTVLAEYIGLNRVVTSFQSEDALEKYLNDKDLSFSKKSDIYKIENKNGRQTFASQKTGRQTFSLSNFYKQIENATFDELEPLLLPYVAWLRNNEEYKNIPYNKLLKLALDSIVRYNI